jgi:hypothetical protein
MRLEGRREKAVTKAYLPNDERLPFQFAAAFTAVHIRPALASRSVCVSQHKRFPIKEHYHVMSQYPP